MENQSRLMGGLFSIAEWVMKFAVVNILWILFNFPVVFLLFNMFAVEQIELVFVFLIPFTLLLPFVFFPATTAMFGMAREWVFKDRDNNSVVRSYWRYYKENYKRSMLNGLVITVLWVIWAGDVYFFYEKNLYLFIFFLTMGIGLVVFTINSFSVTVHYSMRYVEALKNSFFITVGSPLLFITIALSSGFILYVSFSFMLFLIPVLTGSLIAFLSFSAFYSSYLKITQSRSVQK